MAVQIEQQSDVETQPKRRLFTVNEYNKMGEVGILDEDDRVELINGEVVIMSPIGSGHMSSVNKLNMLLVRRVGDRAVVSIQNPVRLGDVQEPHPDVALLDPAVQDRRAVPGPEDVFLLIEVSDTTLALDRKIKLPLYAEAGVAEVWIVDLKGGQVHQYTEPKGTTYAGSRTAKRGDTLTVSAFPDVTIAVADILGPAK